MLTTDLAQLPKAEREAALAAMVKKANGPVNGQLESTKNELLSLKHTHGMSTSSMRARFAKGEVKDDWDHARWLILADFVGE